MKVFKILLAASLVVVLASCCSCRRNASRSTMATTLTNTKWSLAELEGSMFDRMGNDGYYITFSNDMRVNGKGDCNNIMGSYDSKGPGTINLKQMASTRAFCLNQQQEDKFVSLLQTIDSYRIDGNILMLFDNGQLKMVMEAE